MEPTAVLELLERDGVTVRSRHTVRTNPFYEVAARVGCCKLFHPAYMHAYWSLWSGLRDARFALIEIGVEKGRSLRLWEECFPRADVWALDADPECRRYASARSRVVTGRQEDPAALARLLEGSGRPTVVVDDGSHVPAHQEAALRALWPALLPGGWYAVEDFAVPFGHGFLRDWSRELDGVDELHYYPDLCVMRKSLT